MKIKRSTLENLYIGFILTLGTSYLVYMALFLYRGLFDPKYCLIMGGQTGAMRIIKVDKK